VRGAGAASDQGGDPGSKRIVDLLRADEMNVSVDPSCSDDVSLARDHLCPRADHDSDAWLDIGVARLADG
jgi:hypothetical protein